MYTGDFIEIMTNLIQTKTYDFNSSLLVQIFDTLVGQLRQKEPPSEEDWMVKTCVDMVNDAQTPGLDLDGPPEG